MVHPAPDDHGIAIAACGTPCEEIPCEDAPDSWIGDGYMVPVPGYHPGTLRRNAVPAGIMSSQRRFPSELRPRGTNKIDNLHHPTNQEVAGSSPAGPAILLGGARNDLA